MTLRSTSGKFSLPSFGRKASTAQDGPGSPIRSNGNQYEDPGSPGREGGFSFGNGNSNGGGGSGGNNAFDGLGKKLGKSIAHQSLLPGLGNKEQRALQE